MGRDDVSECEKEFTMVQNCLKMGQFPMSLERVHAARLHAAKRSAQCEQVNKLAVRVNEGEYVQTPITDYGLYQTTVKCGIYHL